MRNTKKGMITLAGVALITIASLISSIYTVSQTDELKKDVKEMKIAKGVEAKSTTNTNK